MFLFFLQEERGSSFNPWVSKELKIQPSFCASGKSSPRPAGMTRLTEDSDSTEWKRDYRTSFTEIYVRPVRRRSPLLERVIV